MSATTLLSSDSILSRLLDVRITQARHSSLSGFPSLRTFLPSKTAERGNAPQTAAITEGADTGQLRHLVPPEDPEVDHLLMDATSLTALQAAPETSTSLPVRRTILSAPPAELMASTMHLMHSSDPGTGASLQLLQSITRASP